MIGTAQGPVSLSARDLSAAGFLGADSTGGDAIATLATGAAGEVVTAGRDGQLAWVEWRTLRVSASGDRESGYAVAWGAADGPWLYTASADVRDDLLSAVGSFLAALAVDR